MSYNQTQTAKEILSNEECIELVKSLKNVLEYAEVSFNQALYNTATPVLVDELRNLVELANHLRELPFLSTEDSKTRKYFEDSLKSYESKQNKIPTSILSNISNIF